MPKKPPDYRTLARRWPSKDHQKEVSKICDSIEASKSAGRSDPLKHVPRHLQVLRRAEADLKKLADQLKQDKQQREALKELQALQQTLADEVAIFSRVK